MNVFLERYKKLGQTFNPEEIQLKPSLRVLDKSILPRLKSQGVKLEPVSFIKDAYYFEAPFALSTTMEYLLGKIYLQEVASMLPPVVLLSDYDGREVTVLDMAAAPGSKTTQLASLINGVVIALDSNIHRLSVLRNNIERLGLTNIVTYKKDARYSDDLHKEFDYVLLDAPCSGNFCVEREFFSKKTLDGVRERSKLQKELLRSAFKVVKKGGVLVYSTCSLEPEEDELVINWFINKYEVDILPIDLPLGDDGYTSVFGDELSNEVRHTKRFWPHKTGTEGFFIAKFRKR